MGDFKTNQIMFWAGSKVSDHGRAPLEVTFERIERKSRMARGTLRRYYVTQKRTWSTSWTMLPTLTSEVVDGGMTGPQMKAFVDSNSGPFTMILRDGAGAQETVTVMIADFTHTIVKRGNANDFWDASVSLEEV